MKVLLDSLLIHFCSCVSSSVVPECEHCSHEICEGKVAWKMEPGSFSRALWPLKEGVTCSVTQASGPGSPFFLHDRLALASVEKEEPVLHSFCHFVSSWASRRDLSDLILCSSLFCCGVFRFYFGRSSSVLTFLSSLTCAELRLGLPAALWARPSGSLAPN